MTTTTLVRWGGAGLSVAALGFGLPLLANAAPASAQTAPGTAACSTPTPTTSASATPTATTSPTSGAPSLPSIIATLLPGNSASPTATTTPSATATASTTPCATGSPSATATATTTPSATTTVTTSPSATSTVSPPAGVVCTNPAGIRLSRAFITPGIPVRVTVTAPVGADVELKAYSRPSTEYKVVRRGTVASANGITFDVTPGTNTRLFAACVGQTRSASASQVINVRTALSLTVVRNGTRNYTFQGRILPRRAGQLITLYRVQNDGSRVLTSQLKTDSTGTYRLRRQFTGSGRFGFLTRTGQTLTNAAGESNTPQTVAGVNAGRGQARPTAIF